MQKLLVHGDVLTAFEVDAISGEHLKTIGKWHLVPALWNEDGTIISDDISTRLRAIENHPALAVPPLD